MIKSIVSGSPAHKFVAYSGSESDLLSSLRYFNNVHKTFGEMFVPDIHRNLVKTIFHDLSKEIQTLIIRNGELPNLSKKEQVLTRAEGYVSIVKRAFASLPEETQALIVEKLKYYQVNGMYLNLKPSAALYQAYMDIQPAQENRTTMITLGEEKLPESFVPQIPIVDLLVNENLQRDRRREAIEQGNR